MLGRHEPHGPGELCAPAEALYTRALAQGQLPESELAAAPCLLDAGLLQPDIEEPLRFLPLPPAVALPRMLRTLENRIADYRRRGDELAASFVPLMAIESQHPGASTHTPFVALQGIESIMAAVTNAAGRSQEILAVRRGRRAAEAVDDALAAERLVAERGGRIRTLYQHTQRHSPVVGAHCEELGVHDFQARTLDQITDRLIVLDRKIAFIPLDEGHEAALEVAHPVVIRYLVDLFDQLWELAVPLFPETGALPPAADGVTARQRDIAALLVEGETDSRIAERLGMNVRTCRTHIARLAQFLGSENRTQLGFLISRSGILDRCPRTRLTRQPTA